jgi:hypothetical protein
MENLQFVYKTGMDKSSRCRLRVTEIFMSDAQQNFGIA